MINLSEDNFVIKDGERNYQKIIAKHEKAEWTGAEKLKKLTEDKTV